MKWTSFLFIVLATFIMVGCRARRIVESSSIDSIQNNVLNERLVYREKLNIKDSVRYEVRGCTVFVDKWHSYIYESKDTVTKMDTVYRYIRNNSTVTVTKKDNIDSNYFVIVIAFILGLVVSTFILAKWRKKE